MNRNFALAQQQAQDHEIAVEALLDKLYFDSVADVLYLIESARNDSQEMGNRRTLTALRDRIEESVREAAEYMVPHEN